MPTKYCEVCSRQVVNLKRHINSEKHKRFQHLSEYGNYPDHQQNNILRKQLKDKGLSYYWGLVLLIIAYLKSILFK
jgi:hypothetical protein